MYKFVSAGPFGGLNLNNTLQTIYTVPAGNLLRVESFVVINTGPSNDSVKIWLNNQNNTDLIMPQFSLGPYARRVRRRQIWTFTAGDVVKGLNINNTTGIYVWLHGVLYAN